MINVQEIYNFADQISHKQLSDRPNEDELNHSLHHSSSKVVPITKKKIHGRRFKGFGKNHLPPPVSKALFSFASLRASARKTPIDYGAKLLGYRLTMEESKDKNN